MLELYHATQGMMETKVTQEAEEKAKKQAEMGAKNLQQVLKPVLRDIAQSVLVCFFNSGFDGAQNEHHRKLLAQLINDCDEVQREEMSQTVRNKAFNRLKVAKEIFRSKLSLRVIE